MIKKSLSVLAVLVLMIFMVGVVSAQERYVDKTGSDANVECDGIGVNACLTIQVALNKAVTGDVIQVSAGTYTETLILNKSVTLKSSGGAFTTLINGSLNITNTTANNAVIGGESGRGFTFLNSSDQTETWSTENLHLISIEAGSTATTFGPSNITISYNTFNATGINVTQTGILIQANITSLNIHNNTFRINNSNASNGYSNSSYLNNGILAEDVYNISGINISDNAFEGPMVIYEVNVNKTGIHISVFDVSTIPSFISGNTFTNLTEAIVIGNISGGIMFNSSYLQINDNTFSDNNFSIRIISAHNYTANETQDIRIIDNNFTLIKNIGIDINGSISRIALGPHLHPANFSIYNNTFYSSRGLSLSISNNVTGSTNVVIAESNWWNNVTGPGGAKGGVGYGGVGGGMNISRYVDFSPWCDDATGFCNSTRNIQVNTSCADTTAFNLSAAIGNASSGDIIEIVESANGITSESNFTIDKSLSIIGAGTTLTSIVPGDQNFGFNITADNVLIQNLNISITNPGIVYNLTGGTINNDTYDQNNTESEIYAINILASNGVTINNTIINTHGNRTIGIRIGGVPNITTSNSEAVVTNLTIISNTITINGTGVGIYAAPGNDTGVLHSEWTIGGVTTGNVITLTDGWGEGNCMELYDVNNSVVSYNNLTSNITYGKTNFIWASMLHNISELTFVHNIVNGTRDNATTYGVVIFRNNTNLSSSLYNINFSYNTIENWGNSTGVWFDRMGVDSASVEANYNSFSNDQYITGYAMKNNDTVEINASFNWWGHAGGPGTNDSTGGPISTYIDFHPWYTNSGKTTVSSNGTTTTTPPATNGGSSGSLPAVITWKMTYISSEEELESAGGYNKKLGVKNRVKFKLGENYHHVGVKSLTESTATVEVSSEVQEASLVVGDIRKFDITDDGFYDLSVVLNSIASSKADITIKKIHEEITEETEEEEEAREAEADKLKEAEEEAAKQRRIWTWIIIGIIVVVLILVGVGYGVKKKRK